MPRTGIWSESQETAWEYVRHGLDEGLTQTGALEAYRAGGGSIRNSWWGQLWREGAAAAEVWDTLGFLRNEDTVSESAFERTDIGFSQPYVMGIQVRARTENGEVIPELYRYVESDRRLTWGEWQAAAQDALLSDPSAQGIDYYEMTDISFFQSGGLE